MKRIYDSPRDEDGCKKPLLVENLEHEILYDIFQKAEKAIFHSLVDVYGSRVNGIKPMPI